MALFKKKKTDETNAPKSAPKGAEKGDASAKGKKNSALAKSKKTDAMHVRRDRRKAASFFKHAVTVADTRNYDYAIDLYISGLKHDPDNMDKHEALRDVALRRKVGGGKPPTLGDKIRFRLKDPIDKFLHAEMLWSKEPLSLSRMFVVIDRAKEADVAQDDYNFGEVAHWIGVLILEKGETDQMLRKEHCIKLRDLFSDLGAFDKAILALTHAMDLDPNDEQLDTDLRDLQAESAMMQSGYATKNVAEVDYRGSVRDAEGQAAKQQELQQGKTDDVKDQILERCREAFEKDQSDDALRQKLVAALLDKGSVALESQAIELLDEIHKKTSIYKYVMQIGNIKLKQADRQLAVLKAEFEKDKTNEHNKKNYKEFIGKKIRFEMQQFVERAKNYPTEMKWRYELGKRFFLIRKYDEAIEHFQKAVGDPKYRSLANNYMGQSFIAKKWFDEAIETLKKSLAVHKNIDDRVGLEMRYNLMNALEKSAEAEKQLDQLKEAQKIASEILQANINYKDIRQRVEKMKKMAREIQKS